MPDGSPFATWTRIAGLAASLMLAVGCATSTSTSGSPQIASDLRPASRSDDGAAVSRETRAQQLFLRGMTQARLGNHEAALDIYSQALQLAPETGGILAAMASSQQALGDETTARYTLRRAVALDPDNVFYALDLAGLFLSAGDDEEAARIYADVLVRSPHNMDALYELARIRTMSGDLDGAVSAYERIMDELGGDRSVQEQILHLYARMDDLVGMERTLKVLLETESNEPELHRMLAEVYVKQDRTEDAVEELRHALDEHPGDLQTMLSLAELYRDTDRADEAERLMAQAANLETTNPEQLMVRAAALRGQAHRDAEARSALVSVLERVLELDAENQDALLMLGRLRLDEEAYAEAGRLLYRSLEVSPRDPQVWLQASNAFLQSGSMDRAVVVADEGLLLFPGSVPLLRVAGYALMAEYRNREAIERFEEAVRIIREDESEGAAGLADIYSALGLLYTRTGDADGSDTAYERALALEPRHVTTLNNFAYQLAQRGVNLDRARDMAEMAVEIEPASASYLDTLGWVLYRLARYRAALEVLLRAADLNEASAVVFEHLGDVHQALGDADLAVDAWSRAIEMNPANAGVREKLDVVSP